MRSLVNEKVKHIRYGNGVVEAEEVKKIFVKFKDLEEVKAFPFPCSFEHFLMLEDEDHALAVEKRMEKEKEDEAKIEEFLQKDIERRQAERATKRRTVKKKA